MFLESIVISMLSNARRCIFIMFSKIYKGGFVMHTEASNMYVQLIFNLKILISKYNK